LSLFLATKDRKYSINFLILKKFLQILSRKIVSKNPEKAFFEVAEDKSLGAIERCGS